MVGAFLSAGLRVYQRWKTKKKTARIRKSNTLPSGPGVPPVSQFGPCSVAFERWPGKIIPLSGTENRNVSPKSKVACIPSANHRLPVRFSVKLQNSPTKTTPATPTHPSPEFLKCTAPKETERRTAAGQKPMPSDTV